MSYVPTEQELKLVSVASEELKKEEPEVVLALFYESFLRAFPGWKLDIIVYPPGVKRK